MRAASEQVVVAQATAFPYARHVLSSGRAVTHHRKGSNHILDIELDRDPHFSTSMGAAYCGDALDLMASLPTASVQLILTSPPYALQRPKEYDNVSPEDYVDWFMPFAKEFHRVLREDGSLAINLGASWNAGMPTKSLYQFRLLCKLCGEGLFHLAQDFYWWNQAKLPTPAEWVTVQRVRVKDAVEFVWWLGKSPNPKADNRQVLEPYSKSMKKLLETGEYNRGTRPSGHSISDGFVGGNGGAIPPNFILCANTASNTRYLRRCRETGTEPHPARFPYAIPDFFIRFLTEPGDLVLDPFAGSCLTGRVAEDMGRTWLCFEVISRYLDGACFHFTEDDLSRPSP